MFIDERKELVEEGNCCGRTISRLAILLIIAGIGLIWF